MDAPRVPLHQKHKGTSGAVKNTTAQHGSVPCAGRTWTALFSTSSIPPHPECVRATLCPCRNAAPCPGVPAYLQFLPRVLSWFSSSWDEPGEKVNANPFHMQAPGLPKAEQGGYPCSHHSFLTAPFCSTWHGLSQEAASSISSRCLGGGGRM